MNSSAFEVNETQKKTPVKASSRITIEAGAEIVWHILTDFAHWDQWNPDVANIAVEGPVGNGSTFRCRAGTARITSTNQKVEPRRLIKWIGRSIGIRAVHVWKLEPRNGRTLVETGESWSGIFAKHSSKKMHLILRRYLDRGLQHLKVEAERRAQVGS
jgi:hypothetical protein